MPPDQWNRNVHTAITKLIWFILFLQNKQTGTILGWHTPNSSTHNNLWLHCSRSLTFVLLSLLQKALIHKLKNTSNSYPMWKPWRWWRKAGHLQQHNSSETNLKTEVNTGVQENAPLCPQSLLSASWGHLQAFLTFQLVTSLLQQSVHLHKKSLLWTVPAILGLKVIKISAA